MFPNEIVSNAPMCNEVNHDKIRKDVKAKLDWKVTFNLLINFSRDSRIKIHQCSMYRFYMLKNCLNLLLLMMRSIPFSMCLLWLWEVFLVIDFIYYNLSEAHLLILLRSVRVKIINQREQHYHKKAENRFKHKLLIMTPEH